MNINKKQVEIKKYTTIMELVPKKQRSNIYGATINGKIHDLHYAIKESGQLDFIYADSDIGKQVYERTLTFLFITAVKSLYEQAHVSIAYSFSNGLYCEVEDDKNSFFDGEKIRQKMKVIIENKEPIHRRIILKEDAVLYFESMMMQDKADLLRYRKSDICSIYRLCNFDDYFYGIMLPDTSFLNQFSLCSYHDGFWLSMKDNLSINLVSFKHSNILNPIGNNKAWQVYLN